MSEKEKLLNNFDIEKRRGEKLKTPEFLEHVDKKYGCWCCCRYGLKNVKEYHIGAYNELWKIAIISYDEGNQIHENSLKEFYYNVLDNKPSDDLIHADWSNIGFQVIDYKFRIKIRELILEQVGIYHCYF